MVQDRVVGVLNVESKRINFFTDDHQRVLSLLAPQIASSVENARLYEELARREQLLEQDLKAARKLQRLLLQSSPEITGLEIGIRSRPAREISGDVYDFFESADNFSVIAFGDVSGKGAAAALYGALLSGLLRIFGPRRKTPAALMKSMNDTLLERRVDAQYATLLVAFWYSDTRMLKLANAGSCTPLILRRGKILSPNVEGVPIGLLGDISYDEVDLQMEPGDVVMIYSDGVEDQANAQGEDFSRARATQLFQDHGEQPPKAIADAVIAALDEYRGATPISDDQSVIVFRILA
jgi:sigma-B regulation protein RsbU (phosphoserine phosphatase)